jgi:hypothetical protein
MEYTKEQFLKTITESVDVSVDEMANWRKMRGEDIKYEEIKDEGELVGWNVMGTPVLFTCGVDINDFMNEKPDLVAKLKEQFGEELKWEQGNLTKCKPRRKLDVKDFPTDGGNVQSKEMDVRYVPSGEKMDATTKIKRKLNQLITEILGNEEVDTRLERLSIPEVRGRDRKHLNRYGEMTNERINYGTHNFNSYKSGQDFLNAVVSRVANKEVPVEYKSYHLARQFNQNYRRWEETKKNEKNYQGKTDVYALDRYGFDEDNLDVTVRSDLNVQGIKSAERYTWIIIFVVKFGKKLRDQYKIGGRLLEDKNITIRKVVELDPEMEFNDQNTVLDNLSIVTALIEGLTELKDEFFTKMKPIEMLSKAKVKQSEVRESVESRVEKISLSVLNEIKNSTKKKDSDSNDTYFKTASAAVEFARTKAEDRGFEIDDQDWNSEITMGGKYGRLRPAEGKTHSFSVGLIKNDKPQKKNLNISLYGMESGKFELTHYIN